MNPIPIGLFGGLLAALFLFGAGEVNAHRVPKNDFQNVDISTAKCCKDFSLMDHTGVRRSVADFRDKVVILVFGFTNCPDICPTAMADMAKVVRKLGPQGGQVQVLFLTLDPDRDTPDALAKYLVSFDRRFLGLRGSQAEMARTARDFRVFFKNEPGPAPDSYLVDHTTGSYVFDRKGKARLFVSHGKPDRLVADIRMLMREP